MRQILLVTNCDCCLILPLALALLVNSTATISAQSSVGSNTSGPGNTVDAREAAHTIDTLLLQEAPPSRGSRQNSFLKRVDDYAFLRRASLDLIGRTPTLDQIDPFVSDSSPDKRYALVERLLGDAQFGENWARYWRDVIMMRRTEPRALQGAAALVDYLAVAFHQNSPWDEIARSFILAEGRITEEGSTALIAAQGGQPEETVAELSRVFLGIQIQCAQCHDHPTDAWTREQFHELAAFFPRVFMRPDPSDGMRSFLITHRDVPPRLRPKIDRYLGELEHYMSDLDDPSANGTLMEPVFFVSGQRLPTGSSDRQRRESLAVWFTEPANEWFAKALVNRVWAELIGTGFYEPIDDIGPERQPVAPRVLEYLAGEFVASGYDIKWLYRTIMSTNLYHSPAKPRDPERHIAFVGTHRQRLRGDQLFSALENLASFNHPMLERRRRPGARRGPQFVFSQTFAFDPSDPRDDVAGSVPQALLMMNSEMLDRALRVHRGSGLDHMLQSGTADATIIERLYLVTLTRPPTRRESGIHRAFIRRSDSRVEAIEDIVWALVNSSEFLHRG